MDTMHKLRAAIMKILGVVITLLFILMTLVGTYQIVTRYFFNRPSTISEELHSPTPLPGCRSWPPPMYSASGTT